MQRLSFFWTVSLIFSFFYLNSCGVNFLNPISSKSSDKYHLQEASQNIDAGEYSQAITNLNQVKTLSNEKVLLTAAATLGVSGLSMWKILIDMIDQDAFSSGKGSGFDKVFNFFSTNIYGIGEVKTSRLEAVRTSIGSLKIAPEQTSQIINFSCFLSGLLILPQSTDGASAMLEASSSLQKILDNSIGSGENKDECPGLDDLNTSLEQLNQINSDFSLAFGQAETCPFLNYVNKSSGMNQVEESLNKYSTQADKGCQKTECDNDPICNALQLGCVKAALASTGEAIAGDGLIASCEILQNCSTPGSCF